MEEPQQEPDIMAETSLGYDDETKSGYVGGTEFDFSTDDGLSEAE